MKADKLQDRLIQEIDSCSAKLEELAKVVIETATTLKIVSRIVFCIVLALITGSIALGYDAIKTKADTPVAKEQYKTTDHRSKEK